MELSAERESIATHRPVVDVHRWRVLAAALFLVVVFLGCGPPDHGRAKNVRRVRLPTHGGRPLETVRGTAVVCRPSDPYYELAEKIARAEDAPLVDEFDRVLDVFPKYVVVVASPAALTSQRLMSIGRVYQDWNYYPAVGIITGSTIEAAERLWSRGRLVRHGNHYVGGDVDILREVYEPTILSPTDSPTVTALSKERLIESLRKASYFYWTRHSGPRSWSWHEQSPDRGADGELRAADIPDLNAAVIYSLTCSSFRPWVEDSIALAFADRGAAAYLGFVNTPHTIAFMQHGALAPGLLSWPEMPMGIVAQVHNKAATTVIFRSPQLFMLGDPRIAMSPHRPYEVVADIVGDHGRRTITGRSDREGILAVKIDGGASYSFLSIANLASVSNGDAFHNARVQTLDLGGDKFLLFVHRGGPFEIELRPDAPAGWTVADTFLDALDFSWAALWLTTYADSNPHIHLVAIAIFAGVLIFHVAKQGTSLGEYRRVFLVSLAISLARTAFFCVRVDDYTVSAVSVAYGAPRIATGSAGVFASTAGGLILMRDARKKLVRVLGLLFAVLRQFWMTAFYFLFTSVLNILTPVTRMTEPWLLRYDKLWLSGIALAVEISLVLAAHRWTLTPSPRGAARVRHDRARPRDRTVADRRLSIVFGLRSSVAYPPYRRRHPPSDRVPHERLRQASRRGSSRPDSVARAGPASTPCDMDRRPSPRESTETRRPGGPGNRRRRRRVSVFCRQSPSV